MWVRIFNCLTPRERVKALMICDEFLTAGTSTLTDDEITIFQNENEILEAEMNRGFVCNHIGDAPKYDTT